MTSGVPSTIDTPRVSVIIVSWNAIDLLRRCFPSVAATTYPNVELVLADNGSTDGSADWVAARFPGTTIIRHPENWGFCRGNNEAVRRTDGDFVVLLNNDVEVEPDWLDRLVERATSDPRIAAVQPKLLQIDHRDRFEYAGAAGGHLDRLGYPFARGRVFFDVESDTGQFDEAADIFWATGAAVLLRRSALDEVGLLDEQFEFHMEEIDLCWRLLRAGYRVTYEPRSRAYHIGGASLPQGTARKTYYNFRNSLLMLYKNLPPAAWRRVFPQRLVLDGVALLRFVAFAEFGQAWAVLRAYRDAHSMKRMYPRDADGIRCSYTGSIVVDYFLRGRKSYGDLPPDRITLGNTP